MHSTSSTLIRATLIAGCLDLLSAFVFSGMKGVGPVTVMQGVASGPFGDGMRDAGLAGAGLGTLVHFSIMTAMVGVFLLASRRIPWLTAKPVQAGALYGLALYGVMYWIVLPMRWPTAFPKTAWWPVTNALFSHIVCVGIPMALVIARRAPRSEATQT